MMRSMCAFVLAAVAGSAASAQVLSWTNPSGGDWFVPSNWSPMNVPDTVGESAVISTPGTYEVTIGSNVTFGALTLDTLSATVSVVSGRIVTATDLDLSGVLRVNPTQGSLTTALVLSNGASGLTGFGSIELNTRNDVSSGGTGQFNTASSVLTVPAGMEIVGSGLITNSTFNSTLRVTGDLIARPGHGLAPLQITNRYSTIDLTGGGELTADGWTLEYQGGTILGGTIAETAGGTLDLRTSTTLDGVTVSVPGAFEVTGGTTISIQNGTTFPAGVRVNPAQSSSTTTFRINDTATDFPGPIELFTRTDAPAANTGTLLAATRTLTIPAGSVVRGSGQITNTVTSGNTLVVAGEIRALPGFGAAPLQIVRFSPIDLTGGGELIADGATLSYSGTIAGGTIRETNGGTLDLLSTTTLDDVAVVIPGAYDILNGRELILLNGTELPGGVRVNPSQGPSTTTLRIGDAVTPLPTVIELSSRPDSTAATAGRLLLTQSMTTIPSGTVVRGSGQISNTTISGNALVVNGEVRALPGVGLAPLQITRHDTIDLTGGGLLVADGWDLDLQTALIMGGTVRSLGSGAVAFATSTTLENVVIDQAGPLDIPSGRTLQLSGDTQIASGVRVNPDQGSSTTTLRLETDATVPPSIELFSRSDAAVANSTLVWRPGVATIPQGTVVEGSGQLSSDSLSGNTLINAGVLRAKPENGASRLLVNNRFDLYRQTATGTLGVFIDVGGDRTTFIDADTVELAGTLRVVMSEGYMPSFADVFEIIENRGTGDFDTLIPPAIATDLVPFVFYRPDGVFFAYTCVVDENKDLVVNIFDVLDFLNLWNAQGPGSDFDGSGSVNIFDVLAFLTEWNMNCG